MSVIAQIAQSIDQPYPILSIIGASNAREARKYADKVLAEYNHLRAEQSEYNRMFRLKSGRFVYDPSMLNRWDYRLALA